MTAGRLLDVTEPQLVTSVCVAAFIAVALFALGRHLSSTTTTS